MSSIKPLHINLYTSVLLWAKPYGILSLKQYFCIITMRKLPIILLFIFCSLQVLAQTDSVVVLPKMTVIQYINQYSAFAVDEMYRS
ncbi:MAG: hypothetical protein LW669_04715, partial [Sphingobacteriales bacterium]|nr:hypothetical protein [Sphingobacteriales bacterium]